MKNLTVRIGERTLIDALDYTVHRGDKLVIAGPNGTGKSTLLQVLDGKRHPSGGMVRLGSGAKPGVFTQQQAKRAGRVIAASTPALPNWKSAATWPASATGARKCSRIAPPSPEANWPACALPSWPSSDPT